MSEGLDFLSELLNSANATPIISPERAAPSTIYDLEYRTAIVACAFFLLSEPPDGQPFGQRQIRYNHLKLAQFVAIRPWLLQVLREWSRAQRNVQASLLTTERLRRGFIGDEMFDSTIDYLFARGVIRRRDKWVVADTKIDFIDTLYQSVHDATLFVRERETLQELAFIAVTDPMLEGW